jgi:hypothetical protein
MSGSRTTDGADAAEFDLTALGWLQFEQLCTELGSACGVAESAWMGEADVARWVCADEPVARAVLGDAVGGSIELRVVWMPRSIDSMLAARERAREAMSPGTEERIGQVVVLTNATANAEFRGLLAEFVPDGTGVSVLGRSELARWVDARPDMSRRVPSLLGVRRLDDLVDETVLRASRFDLTAARALAPTFVATGAYRLCCDALARHGFAVLTGPPEMGKTATARMLALAQLCQGWEVHECTDPDELWRSFRPDRPQVFIADDAFGSTEYRPAAAERWALELDLILKHMDERHWLIWTSRPSPLHAGLRRVHREHGLERFPQPAQVTVDAADLTLEEKVLMLYRHAVAADVPSPDRRALRRWGSDIVAHPHFTPERIRRFVWERLPRLVADPERRAGFGDAIEIEIAEPTQAMGASLDALDADHRELLTAMLDTPPPPVAERDLAAAVRRLGTGLGQPMAMLVDRLSDHFLRSVAPGSVTWVHPSWRDLVIDRLAIDPNRRRVFLERCGIDGLLLALSTRGGPRGERTLPFLAADADWDALLVHVDGVVHGLGDADLVRLLRQLEEVVTNRAAAGDERALAELQAVSHRVLSLIGGGAVDAAALLVLEAWYALADLVAEPADAPDVSTLWVESVPTDSVDLTSPADVALMDTWATLAAILARHDARVLQRLGYPGSVVGVVERLFGTDASHVAAALPKASADALRQTASTLAELFPAQAGHLGRFGRRVAPLLEPATLDESPEGDPPPQGLTPPRGAIVGRVLADLQSPPHRRRRWRPSSWRA